VIVPFELAGTAVLLAVADLRGTRKDGRVLVVAVVIHAEAVKVNVANTVLIDLIVTVVVLVVADVRSAWIDEGI
jgi:hypothetical protein